MRRLTDWSWLNENRGVGGTREHGEIKFNTFIANGKAKPSDGHPVYFKRNKYGKPELTLIEAALSELWFLMLGSEITVKPYVVVEGEEVVGLASEILEYQSLKHHPELRDWDAYVKPLLAKILMMVLIAQEEDFHTDNFGAKTKAKIKSLQVPVVVDHDQSFFEHIYSRLGVGWRFMMRPFGMGRHHLDAADVTNAPMIKTARPMYYPGLPKFGRAKKNYNKSDQAAMDKLRKNAEFNKTKYFTFLKFALLPKELLRDAILQHIPKDSPLSPLLINAFVERQAEITASILGSAEFRKAVIDNQNVYREWFSTEIKKYRAEINLDTPNAIKKVSTKKVFDQFLNVVRKSHIGQDTSLHAAIRSGKFRFDESMKWYGADLHKQNAAAQTPIQLAVKLGLQADKDQNWEQLKYFKRVALFLFKQGAPQPEKYNDLQKLATPADAIQQNTIAKGSFAEIQNIWVEALSDRQFSNLHPKLIQLNMQTGSHIKKTVGQENLSKFLLDTLELSLAKLRDDTSITLKMKKNAALLAFKAILPHLQSNDLNRTLEILHNEKYKFIQQLTSQLEIIRRLKGTYGVTSTYKSIVYAINKELKARKPIADNATKILINNLQKTCSSKLNTFFALPTQRIHKLKPEDQLAIAVAPAPAV